MKIELPENYKDIEIQNFKLTENPTFFIHAVSGWAFHKTKNYALHRRFKLLKPCEYYTR